MTLRWVEDTSDPFFHNILVPTRTPHSQIAALYENDKLIAASFATIDKGSKKIDLENPYFVNKNALTHFLEEIEREAAERHFLSTILFFSDKSENISEIKKVLKDLDWSDTEKWMINCFFDHQFNPPWLSQEYPLPPEYSMKTWSQLREIQIDVLRVKQQQLVFPANLSPFLHYNSSPNFSLCLLHKEEVIGWMMTRQLSDDLISFDSFFIERKYRKLTLILALLSSSVKRVLKSTIPFAVMEVNLMQTDTSYINFVHKRYIPYLTNYNYTLRSWKLIENS